MQPMRARRREGEFRRVTRLAPNRLGLPAAQGRALVLAHAWEDVAGEAVARRAPALRLDHGVLEIELPCEPWAAAMRDLLPRLAGRLAARYPDLGVRRFRLRPGTGGAGASAPVPAVEPEPWHAPPPDA
jgi:hypothetical protein